MLSCVGKVELPAFQGLQCFIFGAKQSTLLGLPDPADNGTEILRKVGHNLPIRRRTHPTRLDSLATPQGEPRILHSNV